MRPLFKDPDGYTLVDLLLALAIASTMIGMAIPTSAAVIDQLRAAGAARYVASSVASLRLEAIRRSSCVALRFEPDGADYRFRMFVDGNGNGLRAADVTAGIDRPSGRIEYLRDSFSGTSFGLIPGTPDLDGGSTGTNGVRIGSSSFFTLAPDGSATSGTLYIRGRRAQYAVRVTGATGRARFHVFDSGTRRWVAR